MLSRTARRDAHCRSFGIRERLRKTTQVAQPANCGATKNPAVTQPVSGMGKIKWGGDAICLRGALLARTAATSSFDHAHLRGPPLRAASEQLRASHSKIDLIALGWSRRAPSPSHQSRPRSAGANPRPGAPLASSPTGPSRWPGNCARGRPACELVDGGCFCLCTDCSSARPSCPRRRRFESNCVRVFAASGARMAMTMERI